jgi:excisionase family DNA binding protein
MEPGKPKRQPKPPTSPPDGVALLKLEEAAYLMGRISVDTVHQLICNGKLPAVRVSGAGSLRVQRSDVEDYLRGQRFIARPPEEVSAEEVARAAMRRLTFRERFKADWNTGIDPIDDVPKKERKVKRSK